MSEGSSEASPSDMDMEVIKPLELYVWSALVLAASLSSEHELKVVVAATGRLLWGEEC